MSFDVDHDQGRSALAEGFAAVMKIWGQRPNRPALTVATLNGFAIPGALCEIEALAEVPST